MKNILVTGGAGYIGCHAVKILSDRGYNVTVVDNLHRGHKELLGSREILLGDVGDYNFLNSIFKKNRFDAVMHFAALALVGESVKEPLKYFANNTVGSMNLLKVMLENRIFRLIFSSTAATYGEPVETPITEDHPTNPINPYGESKLAFEKILFHVSKVSDFRYVTLRYFNVAGAHASGEIGEWHEPETHIVPLALEAVMNGTEFKVFGDDYDTRDGTCVRDYIHVCDLIDAHILAVDHLGKGGDSKTYNLGNGKGFSNREVLDAVKKATGKPLKIVMGPRREGDPAVLVASSKKIEKELGWKPANPSIEKIIESAYKWHKKQTPA